jgi:hypothetical protein
MIVQITAITIDEAIMKKRLPTGEIFSAGLTDRIASFVTSTSSASVGVMNTLTKNSAATPLKPGCKARKRVPTQAVKRGRRKRHQHEVSGIGGDRGDHADKNDHEGEYPLRRDRDELAHERGDQARFLGEAHADHGYQDHADPGEARKLATGLVTMKRMPSGERRLRTAASGVRRCHPTSRHSHRR